MMNGLYSIFPQLPTRHGWVITKDHISDGEEEGTMGPSDTPLQEADIRAKGTPFRMYDDDDNLYYEGRFLALEDEEDPEAEFAPLEDFGTPNAGCTYIKYRSKDGKWRIL